MGDGHLAAHVDVGAVGQERRILFAHWDQEVAELGEVELAILVCVVTPEEQVHIVMRELVEAEMLPQGTDDVLD